MKTFNQWLNESKTPAQIEGELYKQKKKLDQKIAKVVNNFFNNGWSSMSTEEVEEKYPNHKDVKEYRRLNDELNDVNKKLKNISTSRD